MRSGANGRCPSKMRALLATPRHKNSILILRRREEVRNAPGGPPLGRQWHYDPLSMEYDGFMVVINTTAFIGCWGFYWRGLPPPGLNTALIIDCVTAVTICIPHIPAANWTYIRTPYTIYSIVYVKQDRQTGNKELYVFFVPSHHTIWIPNANLIDKPLRQVTYVSIYTSTSILRNT